MSTRRKRPSGNPALRVSSTGIRVQAEHRYHADLDAVLSAFRPGEHLWMAMGMWRLADPSAHHFDLDVENLLTIEGPGCFFCEETWSPELAAQPCRGHGS